MVKNIKKWSGIHTQIRTSTKSQPRLEGHLLPVPAKFGQRPFPRSSVILFTVWQNDRWSHYLRLVGRGNNSGQKQKPQQGVSCTACHRHMIHIHFLPAPLWLVHQTNTVTQQSCHHHMIHIHFPPAPLWLVHETTTSDWALSSEHTTRSNSNEHNLSTGLAKHSSLHLHWQPWQLQTEMISILSVV